MMGFLFIKKVILLCFYKYTNMNKQALENLVRISNKLQKNGNSLFVIIDDIIEDIIKISQMTPVPAMQPMIQPLEPTMKKNKKEKGIKNKNRSKKEND